MKTITRLALAAVVAGALALAVPALAVTFVSGKYRGTTSQRNKRTGHHRKVSFHADDVKGEITNFKVTTTGKCSDGGSSIGTHGPIDTPVNDNGTFSFYGKNKKGTKVKLKGTISGSSASGTIVVKSRFRKSDFKPDPHGSIKCSSGTVKWSAKLSS